MKLSFALGVIVTLAGLSEEIRLNEMHEKRCRVS